MKSGVARVLYRLARPAATGTRPSDSEETLLIPNLPAALAGREKELVQNCRAKGFGIWPTLSEPVQVRVGILNQLSQAAITEIATRFAKAMNDIGAGVDLAKVRHQLDQYYQTAMAAE